MLRIRHLAIFLTLTCLCFYYFKHLYDSLVNERIFEFSIDTTNYQQTLKYQQFPAALTADLEFRYAWHKINRQIVDFHPFWYLTEPTVCTENKRAIMVLYVATPSTADGYSIRKSIRNSWAREAKFNGIEIIFSMGQNDNDNNILELLEENKQFHDILLANFVDSWDNLSLKWWSNNVYHSSRCSKISLMASMDSDTVVLGRNLKKLLRNLNYTSNGFLGCMVISRQPVVRDSKSRYYVSRKQWPGEILPDYCSGTMIIEDVQACKKISNVFPQLGIHFVNSFKIFDVLTGPIAKAAEIKIQHIPGIFPWLPLDDICHSVAIHSVAPKIMAAFFQYRKRCCIENVKYRKCSFNGII